MSDKDAALQRDLTRTALRVLDGAQFALAGSGAIREHGIVDRPTQDVDLFTSNLDPAVFDAAVDKLATALEHDGNTVEQIRRTQQFAQLLITTPDGHSVDMDLAVDWREFDPVTLAVGPVLSLEDAVGSKLNALYTRAEARDFLDVDAIRTSGHFTDEQLLASAAERDAGFDTEMFARQLEQAHRIRPERVSRYSVDADQLAAVQERFTSWAAHLRAASSESIDPRLAEIARLGAVRAAQYEKGRGLPPSAQAESTERRPDAPTIHNGLTR